MDSAAPSEFGSYLVTDGGEVQIMNYHGEYKGLHDWSSCQCCTLDVSHWMPLPGLPHEADNQERSK